MITRRGGAQRPSPAPLIRSRRIRSRCAPDAGHRPRCADGHGRPDRFRTLATQPGRRPCRAPGPSSSVWRPWRSKIPGTVVPWVSTPLTPPKPGWCRWSSPADRRYYPVGWNREIAVDVADRCRVSALAPPGGHRPRIEHSGPRQNYRVRQPRGSATRRLGARFQRATHNRPTRSTERRALPARRRQRLRTCLPC